MACEYAATIRSRTKMAEWEIAEDAQIEDFIEAVNVYCFRAELPSRDFVDMVHKVAAIANLPTRRFSSVLTRTLGSLSSISPKSPPISVNNSNLMRLNHHR